MYTHLTHFMSRQKQTSASNLKGYSVSLESAYLSWFLCSLGSALNLENPAAWPARAIKSQGQIVLDKKI